MDLGLPCHPTVGLYTQMFFSKNGAAGQPWDFGVPCVQTNPRGQVNGISFNALQPRLVKESHSDFLCQFSKKVSWNLVACPCDFPWLNSGSAWFPNSPSLIPRAPWSQAIQGWVALKMEYFKIQGMIFRRFAWFSHPNISDYFMTYPIYYNIPMLAKPCMSSQLFTFHIVA